MGTITNDKGRLSQEEIERMVQEAEEFQEEDKKVREKIESRNQLENYVYSMKNTLSDGEKGVADKIGDEDKEAVEKAIEEANEWLDDNQDAEKEDFEEKLKEVQDVCSPIISKVYRESGGAPGGGGDFNGILNVGAEDKGTGKNEKITITNDKGRLSQEEIERMVQEAEEFQEEDKKVREKIESRNQLENYVYSMKNTLSD